METGDGQTARRTKFEIEYKELNDQQVIVMTNLKKRIYGRLNYNKITSEA